MTKYTSSSALIEVFSYLSIGKNRLILNIFLLYLYNFLASYPGNLLCTTLKKFLELKTKFNSKDNILKESNINDENIVDQLKTSWEVRSFLHACFWIITSALIRQKIKRGAHSRSDFPKLDDGRWKVNIFCRKEWYDMAIYKQKIKDQKPIIRFLKYT